MNNQRLLVGVVGVLVFFVFGTVSPGWAQQCPSLVTNSWFGQLGQEPFRVQVAGSYAYLSDAQYNPFVVGPGGSVGWAGNYLNVIDISDSTGPRIVAKWRPRPIAFDDTGTLLYEVQHGLTITDVSDPAHPILLSTSLEDTLLPSIIAVAGDHAHLVNPEGLVILDVREFMNPLEVGRLAAQWTPVRIVANGGLVFVAVIEDQVRIIDVSDPTNPHEVGSWPTTTVVRDLIVIDESVYVLDAAGDLRVVDVSDPSTPVDLGVLNLGGKVWGGSVSGSLAAFALGPVGVGAFDVSDPRQPQPLAIFPPGGPAWDVALSGATGYVAVGSEGREVPPLLREDEPVYEVGFGGFGGFRVVDLSNLGEPVELASFGLEKTVLDVAVKDGLEYFALGDGGIFVGPPRGPEPYYPPGSVRPGELDTPGFAVGVTPYGQYALVADMHKGLRIIDASVPSDMVEVGFADTPGQAHEVIVSGNHAYVADGDSGLRVIDISDPVSPLEVGAIDTPGDAIGLAVSGDFAYVADGEAGLRIIDVSDPTQPIEVSVPHWIADARAVAVVGDMAFIVSRVVFFYESMTVFEALDISDPTDPQHVWIGELTLSGDPTGIALSGAFAYITTRDAPGAGPGRLDIVDISNLSLLERIAGWEHPGGANGLRVDGGRVYLAGGVKGVPVLDVRCLTTYWVDIVAHTSGLDNSEWRTDVIINNEHRRRDVSFKGTLDDPYTVEFILHTADGGFTSEGAIVPEGQGVYEDIVGMLGYEGIGALEVHTEVPVTIFSRVYNDTENGTLGAMIPAYRSTDCLGRWEDAGWLYGLRQVEGEYRTNISITNTGTGPFWAHITLYRTDGRYLTDYPLRVDPGMVVQDLQPFKRRAGQPNVGWGFAKVVGNGILASATVIDSRTSDAFVVPMVR